jgi:hypothetical protein
MKSASIEQSKRTFRKQLAARPVAEKLRMLDALRERTLAIRRASDSGAKKKAIIQEKPLRQRTKSPWRPSPDNQ